MDGDIDSVAFLKFLGVLMVALGCVILGKSLSEDRLTPILTISGYASGDQEKQLIGIVDKQMDQIKRLSAGITERDEQLARERIARERAQQMFLKCNVERNLRYDFIVGEGK